jgi:hypothetical protein
MPTLELSDEQVLGLVKQLPRERQDLLFERLATNCWPEWEELSRYGQERARAVTASRGLNWDEMTEEQREDFVNDLMHEA